MLSFVKFEDNYNHFWGGRLKNRNILWCEKLCVDGWKFTGYLNKI